MTPLLVALLLAATPSTIPLAQEKTLQEKMVEIAKETGAVTFQPPPNWRLAEPSALPPNVKVMVVGKGNSAFPPSLNLATDHFVGTLKEYLRIVKAKNEKWGDDFRDLGVIRTDAGDASLSQVDTKTKWGTERLMHVILVKNDHVYILTAAALKEEFPKYYKDFFNSFRSLKINKDIYELLGNPAKIAGLKNAIQEVGFEWKNYKQRAERATILTPDTGADLRLFEGADFQQKYWNAFKTYLSKDFPDMPGTWHIEVLAYARNQLLYQNPMKN